MIFLLCQFVNHLEVIRLPIYHPNEQEKEDPKLYAENARKLMAREVCIRVQNLMLLKRITMSLFIRDLIK